ncbi:hypothetical protein [Halopseudomonas salina]|uniref:Uncharacterized protein n=1 Tax=Halopseudomonas salina TaxID=1323744 RepID=A0ABQ1P621_9GAMM|nr:hypothetical protein [Halopseudomonas salina]GGC87494.1 hypothetical protein GCM10007418_04060 [Halopseudomonas salina]
MQKFANNWATVLSAPLASTDNTLTVPTAQADKLTFASGDYYDLTIDPNGDAPEILRITGKSGGVLTIGSRAREGTVTPGSWAADTVIACTVTAAFAELIQQGGASAGSPAILVDEEAGTFAVPAGAANVCVFMGLGDVVLDLPVPSAGQGHSFDLYVSGGAEAGDLRLRLTGGPISILGGPAFQSGNDLNGDLVITPSSDYFYGRVVLSSASTEVSFGLFLLTSDSAWFALTPPDPQPN